jgi:hypothetical protein
MIALFLARARWAMCIYRRKLRRILRKRVARSYCSRPLRRSIRSTTRGRRRLAFLLAESNPPRPKPKIGRIPLTRCGAPAVSSVWRYGVPKGCWCVRLCLARFSRSRLQLFDSRLAAALSGDFVRRLRTVLPRSWMSSIMLRNAALAAASISSSNLIVIKAPGVSARSDLRWRSERTWNSNAPASAASIAVKHGSAWTYQGSLQLNYGLHPQ